MPIQDAPGSAGSVALELGRRIGYTFARGDLALTALTHKSYGPVHNERLEFLGDGVLDCVTAQLLVERFPAWSEGQLSRSRASLVNQETLAALAVELSLGGLLRLGQGGLRGADHRRPSILADALEAVFGAVFLDGGYTAAHAVIAGCYGQRLASLDPGEAPGKDHKTLLQEWLQGRHWDLPRYEVVEVRGEAHNQLFRVTCQAGVPPRTASGQGSTRRAAEQQAAAALHRELLKP